jgi:hypothetical protein
MEPDKWGYSHFITQPDPSRIEGDFNASASGFSLNSGWGMRD